MIYGDDPSESMRSILARSKHSFLRTDGDIVDDLQETYSPPILGINGLP